MVAIAKALTLISVATAAVVFRRDAAQVLTDLEQINSDTTALTTAVNNYNGGLANAVPIISAESTLENDLKTATTDANNSGTVSESDAQNILDYITNTLEPNIETSLTALKAKKSDFDTDGLTPTVESDLQTLKTDTDNLGAALIAHTPSDLVTQAQTIQAKIDADFTDAINYFSS